jgi:hypothetical protein
MCDDERNVLDVGKLEFLKYFCACKCTFIKWLQKTIIYPRPVSHSCDPSYAGGGDQEDYGLWAAWAKSYWEPISINNPGIVVSTCVPSYMGDIGS